MIGGELHQTYDLQNLFYGIAANTPIGIFLLGNLYVAVVERETLMVQVLAGLTFLVVVILCGILSSLVYELKQTYQDFFVFLSYWIPFSILELFAAFTIRFDYYFAYSWRIALLIPGTAGFALLSWFFWLIIYIRLRKRVQATNLLNPTT